VAGCSRPETEAGCLWRRRGIAVAVEVVDAGFAPLLSGPLGSGHRTAYRESSHRTSTEIKTAHRHNEDERAVLPRYHLCSPKAGALVPRPPSGRRVNGRTRAGLLRAAARFFGSQAGRPSALLHRGGFQPVAPASLSARWRVLLPVQATMRLEFIIAGRTTVNTVDPPSAILRCASPLVGMAR
jgi:hypothetical protein